MHSASFLLVCLAVICTAAASAIQISSSFDCALRGTCREHDWVGVGPARLEDSHNIIIAVKQQEGSEATCDSLLQKVSDPDSKDYGNYFSMQDIKEVFSKPASAVAIETWLLSAGVLKENIYTTKNFDFIRASAPVKLLSQLFGAKFQMFHSAKIDSTILRTLSYSIPEEMEEHIDFVGHMTRFPPTKGGILLSGLRQDGNVSPSTITQFYGVGSNTVNNTGATQSLFESLGQSFSPSDLAAFQSQFGLPNFPVGKVIGPNDPSQCSVDPNNCGEANLDVQYIMAVAVKAPTTYWSIPGENEIFVDWASAVADDANPPLVHSISYGSLAKEEPVNDMIRFNTEVCKLGLRGLTIMVASGDDGVANFAARDDPSQCGFDPSYPATSPYVTAVGATQGPEAGRPEIACTSAAGGLITTGGGFSINFPRPSYQDAAVSSYLSTGPNLPPFSQFNSKGRAYPDVALLGHNYQIIIGGNTYVGSGTSASTPVFAGMVTLVNNARLNAKKPPVGFINPALYKFGASNPSIYNDITAGENNCCAGQAGSQVCCQYGFNATRGWDPVTGWGSVRFGQFLNAFYNL